MAIRTSTNAMPGRGEWPLRATQLGFGVKGGLLKVLRALTTGSLRPSQLAIARPPERRSAGNEDRLVAKIGYLFR
jgi:hypothetical protein